MKKNVYMVQANYLHGNSTYLPFAVGTLVAYAKANKKIDETYNFGEIFFLRENTDIVVEKMKSPFIAAFSNYIWNYEYNKLLAKKVKQAYPDCIIIFGGHHVGRGQELFDECPFADYFIFGEGEEVFAKLLLSFEGGFSADEVPNIAYRKNGRIVFTEKKHLTGTDYPSPYLTGCFDDILNKNKNLNFFAVIETSRGCPYNCKYCDWGNLDSKKVKFFPVERIYREIEWLGEKGIDGFGGADANFGISKRDEEIIDKMIEVHSKTGHLKNFQTSYAKNSNETVFNMTSKLNSCGMNKGVTLSFQSLCPEALKNVGRENIPIDNYKILLKKYAEAGIATYTELILGLPGETYESFVEGVNVLLEAGQHHAIYVHNCEYLPCAGMSDKEYTSKFRLGISKIPLNQPHRSVDEHDEVTEYSRIITSTYSMPEKYWIKANVFSAGVQCLHHGGFLPFIAIYLHSEYGIKYSDFYTGLLDYFSPIDGSLVKTVFKKIQKRFSEVISLNNQLTFYDEKFGNVLWPAEEYGILCLAYERKRFYNETKSYCEKYFDNKELFDNLFFFQQAMLKKQICEYREISLKYDFPEYFKAVIGDKKRELKKGSFKYKINNVKQYDTFEDYARYCVWYGRKEYGSVYINDLEKL